MMRVYSRVDIDKYYDESLPEDDFYVSIITGFLENW
jgi:hypothetical protein